MNKRILILTCSGLVLVSIALVWSVNYSFVISLAASLAAAAIWAFAVYAARMPASPEVWPNRDRARPTLMERISGAQSSLFLVGFSFESTFKDYSGTLARALNSNQNLRVRILMLHPDSLHVAAHQEFATHDIRRSIVDTVNGRLRALYDSLSESARARLEVRATHYLPRFAARVTDESEMFLNLYLFKSGAHENPVIELSRHLHRESFDGILGSLNELFDHGARKGCSLPNRKIVDGGRWQGLPNE